MAGIDLNKLREAHAKLKENSGGGDSGDKYIILKEGTNVVRILPPKDTDNDTFYVQTSIHRVQDAEGNNKNVHCLKTHGKDCPLCDAYYELWKKHNALYPDKAESKKANSEFKKAARAIKPNKRFYMNVLDREDENKVKVLSVGIKLYEKIVEDMIGDFGDITQLKGGNDFKVIKDTEGKDWPDYSKSGTRPKSTDAGTDKEIKEIMDNLHDIKSLVKVEDVEEVQKIANLYCPKEISVEEATPDSEDNTSEEDFTKTLAS